MYDINCKYKNIDISEEIEKNHFQGAILAISKGDRIVEQGYGFADEENAILNTPETVFRIGSISKQFTGVAVLQLQERGMLSVNDTLDNYFPALRDGKIITIKQMLDMTAGFDHSFVYYKVQNKTNLKQGAFLEKYSEEIDKFNFSSHTKEELLALLNEKPLLYKPGSSGSYSNIGYTLAAYIIEQLSGLSFAEYLHKNIFEPFGLKHTFDITVRGKKAKDYNPDVNNMELDDQFIKLSGIIMLN
jgi:CubicO group peptidase (beta-lactamase class C family)